MKYRVDVIKKLLNCVYDSELPYSTPTKLLSIIKKYYPEKSEEFFVAYRGVLKELNLMRSTHDDFGMSITAFNQILHDSGTKIYLTYAGQEFLEKLNDEAIWNKICKNGSSLGLGALKVVGTSLLQQYLANL
jgi:hypothetical protein